MIGNDHYADTCDACQTKLIDATIHYVGYLNRQRYCAACCECAWRSYA